MPRTGSAVSSPFFFEPEHDFSRPCLHRPHSPRIPRSTPATVQLRQAGREHSDRPAHTEFEISFVDGSAHISVARKVIRRLAQFSQSEVTPPPACKNKRQTKTPPADQSAKRVRATAGEAIRLSRMTWCRNSAGEWQDIDRRSGH